MSRKQEITSKIQSAAIEEFILKGLDSGSMENIAKLADVSKRTLYKYYPNKDAIFDDIIGLLLESFQVYSRFSYNPEQNLENQLELIINSKLEMITSDEYIKISKLVLSEILKSKKLSEEHLTEFYASEQKFIDWINEAKKDNKITSNLSADLIANQFHSIIKGQIFYPVIFGVLELTAEDIQNAKLTAKEFFIRSFCAH